LVNEALLMVSHGMPGATCYRTESTGQCLFAS